MQQLGLIRSPYCDRILARSPSVFCSQAPKVLTAAGQHKIPWRWFATHHHEQRFLDQVLAPPGSPRTKSKKAAHVHTHGAQASSEVAHDLHFTRPVNLKEL